MEKNKEKLEEEQQQQQKKERSYEQGLHDGVEFALTNVHCMIFDPFSTSMRLCLFPKDGDVLESAMLVLGLYQKEALKYFGGGKEGAL